MQVPSRETRNTDNEDYSTAESDDEQVKPEAEEKLVKQINETADTVFFQLEAFI